MNWLKMGSLLAPFVVSILVSVALGILTFRKYIAPDILTALETAENTITNLAKLSGVKSQEYKDAKTIEKVVAADLIKQKLPELEALKLMLSPDTWEQIEETIEGNPEAVIQLYEKYGHLFGKTEESDTDHTDF